MSEEIIVVWTEHGEIRLCPTEQHAIAERLRGHLAMGPEMTKALNDVGAVFPESHVEGVRQK
jgi:hypothetical protein